MTGWSELLGAILGVAKDIEEKRSHYEPSFVGSVHEELFKLDEHDFVPHFQRVAISGEDTSGISANSPTRIRSDMIDRLQYEEMVKESVTHIKVHIE
ncbi:AMP deaminase 3 [Homalodisca vitripennis]|nr:AMP deaminase 3 [Homalodisca vitripennis]